MNPTPTRLAILLWTSLILFAAAARAAVVTANFTSATTVPVTVASYTATGNTVNFSLNFAPPAGTDLTVVKNTGVAFIQGSFGNLAQGQQVNLTYGGVTYPFVANYYGGTGNDLVLQWASSRLVAWGSNGSGELGNNTTTSSSIAVGVDMSGALAGKRAVALALGTGFNLGLCADGTLVAWGSNTYGQLGNNSTSNLSAPGLVSQTGVLAGKTVVAIATGGSHSLVLCADGTLASWGYNSYGQLGNGTTTNSSVPVLVNQTGVLAGKTVVALAAGTYHNLVLCSDGTLASWGDNGGGQLGNAGTVNSNVPVLVSRTGVLAGKTVTTIATGQGHGLALCAEGSLATWGSNFFGQLGNSGTTDSSVPVLVNQSGVLAGKTLVACGGGAEHSLALCSDGTVSAWGYNSYGNLGNNSSSESHVPVLVYTTGVLAGKTVVSIAAGDSYNLALCADRTLVAWGNNSSGQLGNASTTGSSVPVLVGSSLLGTGERFTAMKAGYSHSLALVAMPPPPVATTLAASAIGDMAATLNGSINAQGTATAAWFEYGLTASYGTKVAATPATVTGTATTAASTTLSGLLSGTTYHYRMVAASGGGTVPGADLTFATSNSACLSSLGVSTGTLKPAFNRDVSRYSLAVGNAAATLSFTPVVFSAGATVTVNGVAVPSGSASGALALAVGSQQIDVVVTGGGNTDTYSVIVTRLPAVFAFNTAASVPVTVGDFLATGNSVSFALNFAPVAGTELMVLKNTGSGQIQGRFDNLAQWQQVNLTYAGITYPFVANYRGGSGNDLVLQWANTRLLGWGWNGEGELGNNSMANSPVPVSVDLSGVLAGKTVVAVCPGTSHNLALCADGTLATWGGNTYGQLGNNSSTTCVAPVAVSQAGVLAGRTVVAVCAGGNHNLALCADGSLAAWGYNSSGQLGNKSNTNSSVPVLVDLTGVLAGKTIVALGAGSNHSLALCADGTLAAWGDNSYGQFGNGSTTSSNVPVWVSQTGVLAGKTLIAIAGGGPGSLGLCADGTLAAWGTNSYGQLGNNSPASGSSLPVAVSQSGVLAGKTVVAIAGGGGQSLVLCSDGTIAVWGDNTWGALGTSDVNQSNVPILPNLSGVLAGKSFAAIGAGSSHSLVLCTDGTAAAWGYNTYGQLGNNSTNQSYVPVLINASALKPGERFLTLRGGSNHSMALVASPPPPVATTLAVGSVLDTSATLNGNVNAQGSSCTVTFEYGLTTAYGAGVAATPGTVTGTTTTAVSAVASGLLSGTTYHYRAVASSAGGIVKGADLTFTTSSLACLASLGVSSGTLTPGFDNKLTNYSLSVPFAVTSLSLTPVVLSPGATVTVGGVAVASGSASGTLDLTVGSNPVSVVVSAVDPTNTQTYTVTVTRLPAVCAFASATTVPVTVRDFAAGGQTVAFALNFAPPVGTNLTAVKCTGYGPIQGTFDNLAQGQLVNLTYGGVTYAFVANYGGGSGNDLVLQWANTRAVIWGGNSGGPGVSNAPAPVDTSGVLAGKTFLTLAAGNGYSLALCADGTLAGWGTNTSSQLGNGGTTSSALPVLVNQSGVLAGKVVMDLAAGSAHSLALCADGTLAAWGANGSGQLGNGTTTNGTVPVLVNQTGVLAGKVITAIAAGASHSLALCADGSLAAWGANASGQLGNGGVVGSNTPVLVNPAGVLAGKRVTAIAAGGDFCIALCADGTVAAWGANGSLNLGNGTSINSSVPVLVNQTGVLAGKTVLAVSAGTNHGLALCADGSMAAWGNDYYGQLGDGNTDSWSTRPVLVSTTGVLAGKAAVAIATGDSHSLALCADGTLAAWGYNNNGQLGNVVSYESALPVLVITSGLAPGERFASVTSGLTHGLALVASPPPPLVTTLAASAVTDTRATFNASVSAQGSSTNVAFEYGLTTTYGTSVAATPATLSGTTATAASMTLSGLLSATTYHYRIVASSAGGTVKGQDVAFTTTNSASLASLTLDSGTLLPAFASTTLSYVTSVPYATTSVRVTPVCTYPAASVIVNGTAVASGSASPPFTLAVGNNTISTVVTSADGLSSETYPVTVTRLPNGFTFAAASSVPVTTSDFIATGYTATFALGFAPVPGTDLTVVKNTGPRPIQGTFDNLAQGQLVPLNYGGITYPYVANYCGGNGNDLVLQWANSRLLAWGSNGNGQLGNNSTTSSNVPVPVNLGGVLAGKTIVSVAEGAMHSLALCADGTLAAWGYNGSGQLGNNSTTDSWVPVLVNLTGVLAGKTVVAVAAGQYHSLALCADGTVAAWGYNMYGQLGNSTTTTSSVPVLVNLTGALAAKRVSAIAAGNSHNLVLCADGTLVAWGYNSSGQLGNSNLIDSNVPVLVTRSGVLAAKSVTAIACGGAHSLALCADGTVAAWGSDSYGQLGNNATTSSSVPVAVDLTGVLAAKTVTALAAGALHSLALCADGTLAAWGYKSSGQLGNNNTSYPYAASAPVLVTQTGVLAGKTVLTLSAGATHSLALCSDATLAVWGAGGSGQLGNAASADSAVPVVVSTAALATGERFVAAFGGTYQSLARVAMPPAPVVATVAASSILASGATVSGTVNAQGSSTSVTFEYGLTSAYGSPLVASPATLSGATTTAVQARLSGLPSGTTYHYRVIATSAGGTVKGADMTFTTTTDADLASLTPGTGTLLPGFDSKLTAYSLAVPFATASITFTPGLLHPDASSVTIAGTAAVSGSASAPVALTVGNNAVDIVVTPTAGGATKTYTVTVTRLPGVFTYNSATDVPVTLRELVASGNQAAFALNYAPTAGTILTVVNNTGNNPIQGTFDNLSQGQAVALTYAGVTYLFVANYFGGTGNDLVLQWASTRAFGWGANGSGQVGNNSTANALTPVPVNRSGFMASKVPLAVATGSAYTVAVCSDGSLASWGDNSNGQLGNGSTNSSLIPVGVNQSGVLANKMVVAVAAGGGHVVALGADGTLAAWGYNYYKQLGNAGVSYSSSLPVLVDRSGVLANKRVVAVAAGDSHSLALCSDGTVAAWGYNSSGQLGNNSTTTATLPVAVDTSGLLAGKRVIAIAAGGSHSLALCADGTLAAWGANSSGQLGNNTSSNALVPVAVDRSGVLLGKTVTALAGGTSHSLALCADGTLAAWGYNSYGNLGNSSTTNSLVPVAVNRAGVLAGKTPVAVAATTHTSYVWCTDGTLAAWGYNSSGQLGNNTTTQSSVPVTVSSANLAADEHFMALGDGSCGLVASPPRALTPAIADGSAVIGTNQTLAWSMDPLASSYQIYFGTDAAAVANATPDSPEYLGSSSTPAWSGSVPGLALNGSYFWRVDTLYAAGSCPGSVWSFRIAPVEMAASISDTVVAGMAAATVTTPISSSLPASQAWAASLPGAPAWLNLTASSGTTPAQLGLRFDPGGLAPGSYSTLLHVVAGATTFDVPVQFRVVTLNVTKLLAHPNRPVVYGINTAANGETSARLLEIDAATGTILRTLPIGPGPTDLAIDPVHERLYVPNMTNWVQAATHVVDLANWVDLPPLVLGTDTYNLVATGTGRLIAEGWNQWVSDDLYDATTGTKLSTLGAVREGDCKADPSGRYFYHCDADSSGAQIYKYDISGDTFNPVANSPVVAYGSYNLILSGDGSRLYWQGYSFAADNLHPLAQMPAEVYASNRSGDLAIGPSQIWWGDSGTPAAALPFSSTIVAVSANDGYLVRFNSTSMTLQSTPLASLVGLPGPWPRPGQMVSASPQRLTWSAVAGATAYQLFIAADATALQAMSTPTATVTDTFYDLPAPLAAGRYYSWRVDAVLATGSIAKGNVQAFGVRFAEGPAVASGGTVTTGKLTSIGDRYLLLGGSGLAQLYDFDPATGVSSVLRSFTGLSTVAGGVPVAMDAGKAAVGASGYDLPVTDAGAAYVFRPIAAGFWDSGTPLALATPKTSEAFGSGLAASGNLMLVGTGNSSTNTGRVGAYITEPTTVLVQTFSANDPLVGDGFGDVIAMDGNQAVIAAPGPGASSTRAGCLYAFSRSTSSGLWVQTQKMAIAGATSAGGSGKVLALAGNTLATNSDSGAVVIYSKDGSGQWAQSALISPASVATSSTSFGCALALLGDQLFIGDSAATYTLGSSGAVFTFRRSGSTWVAGPTITPAVRPTGAGFTAFGTGLAVRDRWLMAAGGNTQPAWLFQVAPGANQTPRFLPGLPSQVVAGRAFTSAIGAEDADGNTGLVMDLLQGPPWLKLADGGNGTAVLSGTPTGNSGDVSQVQVRVRDAAGTQALYTYRLSVLSSTDLPALTLQPLAGDTSEGRELILSAAAAGIGPFQWQWYHDGNAIDGATLATLAFDEIALTDAGSYSVRVANVVGEAVSAAASVTVRAATRFAGDWPTFGASPAHNGRHPAAFAGFSFVPAWSQTVKSGRALNRAAIAGGSAYVVPRADSTVSNEAKALDLATGNVLWSFPFPASYSSNPPSVFNGRMYFQRVNNENDSFLFCLNANTGAQLWRSPVAAQWESYQAPAITDQGIFVEGGTYGGMCGFNFDGSLRFFQTLDQYDGWCPTVADGHLYTCVGGVFREHNPTDGTTLWSVTTTWNWLGWSANTVVAATGDSAVVFNNAEALCIDLPSRSIRWRQAGAFSGSFAIGSGNLYAIQGAAVRSYALADGTPGVVFQTTATANGLIDQPVIFNDRLLISNPTNTWVFNRADGQLLQTLAAGGPLSYSNSYLLAAGGDGALRAFVALNNNSKLADLSLSSGKLLPEFDSLTTSYISTVPFGTDGLTVTPTTEYPAASVRVNGVPVASGTASGFIPLAVGNNTLTTRVTAEDGIDIMSYTIVVTRLPESFLFNSARDIPVTANGFDTGDYPINVSLNYAPTPGTILTMVNNTSLGFIHGTFSNLTQGQQVRLNYAGMGYDFVANYYGGSGNDLVLQWAATQVAGWGSNSYGQLGDATTTCRLLPTVADDTGVLANKTITAVAEGYLHSLALCSDGTLAAWGYNVYGQLGNNGAAASSVPVAVDRSGALAGKTVISIAAGPFHNLALCADGCVAAWGYNNYGQLGTGDKVTSRVPVLVQQTGALVGKHVVAVAAAAYGSFALCDDGTLAAWGYNDEGELGNGSLTTSSVPVAVATPAGTRIAALAAGQYHTLALCTDGTLLAWGYNNRGQLGNDSTGSNKLPVPIGGFGALAGKSVVAIRASGAHSLAFCTDGTLAAWGWNKSGELGLTGVTQSSVPVAVAMAGASLTQIAIGGSHSLAQLADGTLVAWGDNAYGQLGNDSVTPSAVPVAVDLSGLDAGVHIMALASGSAAQHNLSVVGVPSGVATQNGAGPQDLAAAGSGRNGTSALIAYAFGLDAAGSTAGALPQGKRVGDSYVIEFTQPAGVTNITYGAEWSATLLPGSWTEIPDTGTGDGHIFSVPVDSAPQRFLRLKVTGR